MPDDDVLIIRNKFAPRNRYANFGATIRAISVSGFRGITNLTLQFDYPVTAISGLNGSGKSTIGQLAVCAYRKPTTAINYSRSYVKDFFPVSVADPAPIADDARLVLMYETNQLNAPQEVTVSRVVAEWSGYKRQPERYCYYLGVTLYLPKVERRDLSIYRAKNLELRAIRQIPEETQRRVGRILNQAYDDIHFQAVGHGTKESELGIARRFGHDYSENNMGFGEGRVLYMVDAMEAAPEQSLFVLEEPETSLHEDAQHRLARYFLDVCNRRHHQIVLSTHSSVILEALPPEARKLLYRDAAGVSVFSGISSTRARAILSGGHARALTVCVEDAFAKRILTEIVRIEDRQLLKAISIEPLGSRDAVKAGVDLLTRLNRPAIGIRDGDVGPAPAEGVYSLPGNQAPELEVYANPHVQERFMIAFGVDLINVLAEFGDRDHHDLTERIAELADAPEEHVATVAAQAYAESLPHGVRQTLVQSIADRA